MKTRITKAVLPVAGLGTRVMPLTLHQPKAMIGIVDRPMIHYVIDEVLEAGITDITLVVGPHQSEFKRYFDFLKKDPEWKGIKLNIAIQKQPVGNADAVLSAKKFLHQKPFVVAYTDDLIKERDGNPPAIMTMLKLFYRKRAPVVLLEPVPKSRIHLSGVVKAKKSAIGPDVYEITDIVEKPSTEEAPSNLAVIGRYIITPEIVSRIKELYPFEKRELYLTDAIKLYLQSGGKMYGVRFRGQRFDCGSKIGLLKAQAYFGLHHPELKNEFKKFLFSIFPTSSLPKSAKIKQ